MPKNLIPHLIQDQLQQEQRAGSFVALSMFMDISGFTPMTEALMQKGKEGAEILSGVINGVFREVIDRVYQCGGMITGFAGDAFTAVFPHDDRAMVLATARAIQDIFAGRGLQETRFGDFQLYAKLGLSAGQVEWGLLGEGGDNTFYFRGSAIDGCAQSEHHSGQGQIVMDRPFYQELDFAAVLTRQTDHPDYWLLTGTPDAPEGDFPVAPEVGDETARLFLPDSVVSFDQAGEFRTIVSVFISFAAGLGDDEIGEVVSGLMDIAIPYSGYWGQVDFGDKGATMLVLFGAPVAHEDDLARGLGFALDARERFGDRLRAGITTGPVYAGIVGSERRATYTAMGDVVNLSARLMVQAPPGSLIASADLTRAAEHSFAFEARGPVALKGKSEPQEIFELVGRARGESASGMEAGAMNELIGRDEELALLRQCLSPLESGKFGGILYLFGEAGSGKTRLAAELARMESASQFYFLRAEAILRKSMNPFVNFFTEEFDQNDVHDPDAKKIRFETKFKELIQSLEELNAADRTGPIIQELNRTRSLLGAILAIHWEGSLHESLDAKGRFDNTLIAIKEFFKARSLIKPTVLVLDDFHVLDADSESIVTALTRNIDDFPLLVVAAGRFQDDGEKRSLDLEPEIPRHDWELKSLGESAARRLIGARLEREPDDALQEFIASRTDGNPFFIEQFCLYLREQDLLTETDGRYGLKGPADELPVGINNLLISRLDRLSPRLKEAVQVAAVMGQEFDVLVLGPVLKQDNLAGMLGEGENETLWRSLSPTRYVFQNGLLREAAYDMQLRDRLRNLHNDFALTMERLFPGDETRHADMAYHYEQAEVEDKAREYLFKAGRYALDNYKSERALDYYDRLLKHEVSADEKLEVYRNKSRILELTGRWNEAIEMLEQGITIAFASRNVWERARLMSQMGALHMKQGKYDEAIDFLTRASQTSGDLGDRENEGNALIELGRAYWGKGDLEGSLAQYKSALRVKEEQGDRLGIALAHYYRGVTDRDLGDYEEAMACYEESFKTLEELGEKRYLTYPIYDMGVLYQYRGDLDRALEYFIRSRDAYEEIGYRSGSSAALLNLGVTLVRQGKFEEALKYYDESLKIAEETGEQLAIAYTRFSIGAAYYMEGKHAETIRHFESAFSIMKTIGAKGYYGYIYAYLACTYARMKQPARALKMALVHYKAMDAGAADVENGRTDLGIALALAASRDGQALGENAALYRDTLAKLADVEPTPAAFFETAIIKATQADYINTLVPTLREYGTYLYDHPEGSNNRALELLREARERAAGAGMLRQLNRIRELTEARGIDLDA